MTMQVFYDKSMEPVFIEEPPPEKVDLSKKKEKKKALTVPNKVEGDGRVSIIVLCWNNVKYTKIFIDSIKKQTKPGSYQLIVVDQGSTDETFSYLKENVNGEHDIVICNTQNKGFSGGNNQALKVAECQYVLFINNDCKVLKDNWLDVMIQATKKANLIGALCSKVKPNHRRRQFEHVGSGREGETWSYLEGWCLFSKRDFFLKLGGFDMRFSPAYSEDSDLSFRVKKMGLRIKAINIPVKHFGSKSLGLANKSFPGQSEKSNRILFEKWIGEGDAIENEAEKPLPYRINKRKTSQKPSILLRRKGAKGDVLMVTPIARQLKEKYPESFLVVETESPDIIAGNPDIDHVVRYIPKPGDYDIVLSPRYEDDPGGNAIDVMAKQCKVKLDNRKMDIFLSPDQIRWAKNKIDMSKRYLAFHTGRTWASREWKIEGFRDVASYFLDCGYDIVELGDRQTNYMGLGNDCRGCSIKQTAALIRECVVFVGIDSVCANLAKAVGTAAFIIYGCVDPNTRNADAIEFPIWIDDLECKGCRNRTSAEYVECSKPEIYCLTMVKPDMVIKGVEKFIKDSILGRKAA